MNLNALGKFQKSTQTNAGICNSCSSGCKQMSWGHLFVNYKIHLWIMKYICEWRFVCLWITNHICESCFVRLNRVSFVCELWNKSNSIEISNPLHRAAVKLLSCWQLCAFSKLFDVQDYSIDIWGIFGFMVAGCGLLLKKGTWSSL